MTDTRNARPVSGEIMTDGATAASPGRFGGEADIVDADFETLGTHRDAEGRPDGGATAPATPRGDGGGMTMLRKDAGDRPADARQKRGGPAFWLFGLTLVAGAFWVSGGYALVGTDPAQAGREAFSLSIDNVDSRVETRAGRNFLMIDGEAVNDGQQRQSMPPIAIEVTGDDGLVTRYFLGTNGRSLAPGERFSFSSRLDAPKSGVDDISVKFEAKGE